jgi:hypothetical protein
VSLAGLAVDELAAVICETLRNAGIDVVLTGGSCVSVYTHNAFASLDLDFIALGLHSNREIGVALSELGFQRKTQASRYFTHPETDMVIEFPSGPLMVGNQIIESEHFDKVATRCGTVRLLSPTDCIKDRLAAFYYWNDEQCNRQAIAVASAQRVNWPDLEAWHKQEGVADRFAAFRRAAEEAPAP